MGEGCYIDVHFTRPPFGPYTYCASELPAPGSRVEVEFGRRPAVGLAGRPADAPPGHVAVKGISRVVDAAPLLPPFLWELVELVGRRYAGSPGETARLALPIPLDARRDDLLLLDAAFAASPDVASLSSDEQTVVAAVWEAGWLGSRAAGPNGIIRDLIGRRVLAVEPAASRPTLDDVTAYAVDGPTGKAGKLGQGILDELAAGPLPAKAFFDSPKTSAAFRRLLGGRRVALGLVSVPAENVAASPGTLLLTGGAADARLAAALEEARKDGADSILVLAPETYRVPALCRKCEELTGEAFAPYHSEMTPAARWRTFGRCRRGTVTRVVGTRSALFLPLPPGTPVIMTDEAHAAYKQWETSLYYVAREVAAARAAGTRLVLAGAAPSLESYARVTAGEAESRRVAAEADGAPPTLIDMSKVVGAEGPVILSAKLASAVKDAVRAGGRALVMVNRRGYVPYIYCDVCGAALKCDRCDVAFTYHREEHALRCHYCSRREPLPRYCPSCGKEKFAGVGFGTEKLAREVELLSGTFRVARVDSDALRTPAQVRKRWEEIAAGKYDVVVGTQMARRALEYPAFTLAALASADTAMNVPDFRASERTYRMIRRMLEPSPGRRVIVQTFFPEHYAIAAAAAGDYESFAERELAFRKRLRLPPFSILVNVIVSETKKAAAKDGVRQVAERVKEIFGEAAEIVGPLPAPVARTRGTPRWQILVKTSRAEIEKAGEELAALAHRRGPVGVKVDVDPYDLF